MYDSRKCMNCGKSFEPKYAAQVTCSRICRKARRLECKKVAREKRNAFVEDMGNDLEWANSRIECLLWQLVRQTALALGMEKFVAASIEKAGKADDADAMPGKKPAVNEGKDKPKAAASVKTKEGEYRHICAHCGQTFKSARADDKYCSRDCAYASAAAAL